MALKFDYDPKVIAREGAVFKPDEGLEYPETKNIPGLPAGSGKRRMVATPPTGARLVGVHALTLKPGEQSVLHSHPLSEEVKVCVKGTAAITLGNKVFEFKPGYVLYAPPGVPHGKMKVIGNEEVLVIGTQAPAAHVCTGSPATISDSTLYVGKSWCLSKPVAARVNSPGSLSARSRRF